MEDFRQQLCLLFSLPIYLFFIPLEILLSHFNGWHFYSAKETAMNIYMNLLNAGVDLLLRGLALFILLFFSRYSLPIDWHPAVYWIVLFLCEDVMFWLEHFVDHH